MKKILVCLLLITTICLGCFALTACDDNDSSNAINNPTVKCEFVNNEFKEFTTEYLGNNYHYEWNIYTFRVWYSYSYFLNKVSFPRIICTCPNIISYWGPSMGGIKFDGECTMSNKDYYAEYLLGYQNSRNSIKPDSWIYFSVRLSLSDEFNELSSITIQLEDLAIATYTIDISKTYKTA